MQTYKNSLGNSNVEAYSIGTNYIDVRFQDGSIYRYSYQSTGMYKVEQMKKLAIRGYGLNSYIMNEAKKDYEYKY